MSIGATLQLEAFIDALPPTPPRIGSKSEVLIVGSIARREVRCVVTYDEGVRQLDPKNKDGV